MKLESHTLDIVIIKGILKLQGMNPPNHLMYNFLSQPSSCKNMWSLPVVGSGKRLQTRQRQFPLYQS